MRSLFLVIVIAGASNTVLAAPTVRVTTWNLEWFPNGSPKDAPPAEQQRRIATAADVLRPLNPDILLLQEVRDYATCERLAEAIAPHTYKVAICSTFKEPFQSGFGRQQVAILAKEYAQAAWSEPWKSRDGVDPPRGFAFAWLRLGSVDVGVYSLHLKSNLVIRGDKAAAAQKNIWKREVAAAQLLDHVNTTVRTKMPSISAIVVGGDFNTNADQEMFASENTLALFARAAFHNCMEGLPLVRRITHPANHGYPPASFDYVLARGALLSPPEIVSSRASDHYPLTCDATLVGSATADAPRTAVLIRPVRVVIPYGETVLPAGTRLPIVRMTDTSAELSYVGTTVTVSVDDVSTSK